MERLILGAILVLSVVWLVRFVAASAAARAARGACSGCPLQTECKGGNATRADCEDSNARS